MVCKVLLGVGSQTESKNIKRTTYLSQIDRQGDRCDQIPKERLRHYVGDHPEKPEPVRLASDKPI